MPGCIAAPCSNGSERDDEEEGLDGSGNAEAAKLRTIVNEQVPIAEQCRRRRQNLRHLIPAPKLQRHAKVCAAPHFISLSGAPQPPYQHAVLPIARRWKWRLRGDG